MPSSALIMLGKLMGVHSCKGVRTRKNILLHCLLRMKADAPLHSLEYHCGEHGQRIMSELSCDHVVEVIMLI